MKEITVLSFNFFQFSPSSEVKQGLKTTSVKALTLEGDEHTPAPFPPAQTGKKGANILKTDSLGRAWKTAGNGQGLFLMSRPYHIW